MRAMMRSKVSALLSAQHWADEGAAGFDCSHARLYLGMEQVPPMDHLPPDLKIHPHIGNQTSILFCCADVLRATGL